MALEKRLRCHKVVVGILALFLTLSVGTHVGVNSGELTCTQLTVVNSKGMPAVILGVDDRNGDGVVATYSPEGNLNHPGLAGDSIS